MQRGKKVAELVSRFRYSLGAVFVLVLLVHVYPFQTTIVPSWHLRVINEAGVPLREVKVTEHWQHYLFESEGHEEVQTTAADGQVNFPARTIRASLLRRILSRVGKAASSSGEVRTDASAAVVLWGSREYETTVAVYHEQASPQAEIALHRLP